jgi:hypothetical protein
LIRFASFFFVGFGVQFIFLVLPKSDPEYYITIAALPVSVLLLLMGAFGAGYENVWAMVSDGRTRRSNNVLMSPVSS